MSHNNRKKNKIKSNINVRQELNEKLILWYS